MSDPTYYNSWKAAAQRLEARRRIRGMCHHGCRGGLLSDCGDPAQRRGPSTPPRGNPLQEHALQLLAFPHLSNEPMTWNNEEAGDWKLSPKRDDSNCCAGYYDKNAIQVSNFPKCVFRGLLSSRKRGEHWSILLLTFNGFWMDFGRLTVTQKKQDVALWYALVKVVLILKTQRRMKEIPLLWIPVP